MQDLYSTDQTQEICATSVDHPDCTASTRHELDHTDHTDQEHICPEPFRSWSWNRFCRSSVLCVKQYPTLNASNPPPSQRMVGFRAWHACVVFCFAIGGKRQRKIKHEKRGRHDPCVHFRSLRNADTFVALV